MLARSVLIAALLAYAEARFGQEQIPIPAIQKVQGGNPGQAATIAGAAISDLLAATSACDKVARADQIVSQLGGGADAIAAAKGMLTAEKNTNPFNNGNAQKVCNDASLPATAELRGITPLIDPAANGAADVNGLSNKTATAPLDATGKSIFQLISDAGFGASVVAETAAAKADITGASGGNANQNQNANKGNANKGNANQAAAQASNSTQNAAGNQNANKGNGKANENKGNANQAQNQNAACNAAAAGNAKANKGNKNNGNADAAKSASAAAGTAAAAKANKGNNNGAMAAENSNQNAAAAKANKGNGAMASENQNAEAAKGNKNNGAMASENQNAEAAKANKNNGAMASENQNAQAAKGNKNNGAMAAENSNQNAAAAKADKGNANKGAEAAAAKANKGNENKGNAAAAAAKNGTANAAAACNAQKGQANKGNAGKANNGNAAAANNANKGNANKGNAASSTAAAGNAAATSAASNNAAAGNAAAGGNAAQKSSIAGLDFGTCVPTIKFEGGQGNRPPTEFTFQIIDPVAAKGQQEALNPVIIGNRMCDQLTNVCNANQAAKDACQKALADMKAAGTKDKSTADNWNTALGFAGTVTNPDGGPAEPAASAAAGKTARSFRA